MNIFHLDRFIKEPIEQIKTNAANGASASKWTNNMRGTRSRGRFFPGWISDWRVMGSHNAIIMLLFALYTAGLPNGAFYLSHGTQRVCTKHTRRFLIHHYICICVFAWSWHKALIAQLQSKETWKCGMRLSDQLIFEN
jgi:hypothetical protein